MKLSAVVALLGGTIRASEFSTAIAKELGVHTEALKRIGASAPVEIDEDAEVRLDRSGLGVLCRLYASGQLSASELAYTADALQLSERVSFVEQSVADDLAECTDPEVNGPLTVARALEIADADFAV